MTNSLQKNQRLKREKQIQYLFHKGKSILVYPVKVQYLFQKPAENQAGNFQFGVSVSKRYFKKAVARNLLKRRMREAFRLQKTGLETALAESSGNLSIMFIFVGKEMLEYQIIKEAINQILTRLTKKCR